MEIRTDGLLSDFFNALSPTGGLFGTDGIADLAQTDISTGLPPELGSLEQLSPFAALLGGDVAQTELPSGFGVGVSADQADFAKLAGIATDLAPAEGLVAPQSFVQETISPDQALDLDTDAAAAPIMPTVAKVLAALANPEAAALLNAQPLRQGQPLVALTSPAETAGIAAVDANSTGGVQLSSFEQLAAAADALTVKSGALNHSGIAAPLAPQADTTALTASVGETPTGPFYAGTATKITSFDQLQAAAQSLTATEQTPASALTATADQIETLSLSGGSADDLVLDTVSTPAKGQTSAPTTDPAPMPLKSATPSVAETFETPAMQATSQAAAQAAQAADQATEAVDPLVQQPMVLVQTPTEQLAPKTTPAALQTSRMAANGMAEQAGSQTPADAATANAQSLGAAQAAASKGAPAGQAAQAAIPSQMAAADAAITAAAQAETTKADKAASTAKSTAAAATVIRGTQGTQAAQTLEQLAQNGFADPVAAGLAGGLADPFLDTSAPIFAGTASAAVAQQAVRTVRVQIGQAARGGDNEFTVRLDPPEMGKVTVRMAFEGGLVRATVMSDNPETLNLLQRDSRNLEKALEESGHKVETGGLEYELDEGNKQSAGRAFAEAMLEDQLSLEREAFAMAKEAEGKAVDDAGETEISGDELDVDLDAILAKVDLSTGLDIRV